LARQATQFFESHRELVVACLFALAVAALVSRMLFASPLLDYLYLESPARDRRTMFGFLILTLGLLGQMGLLYAVVLFARPGEPVAYSGMAPMLMLLYLAGGAVWMLLLRIGAKRDDKYALRGFWPAFGVNVAVGALLAAGLWYLDRQAQSDPAEFHANRLHNTSVTAAAALLVCTLDTFFQGRLYGKTGKGGALRAVLMLVLLVALLAAGAYVVYITRPARGI